MITADTVGQKCPDDLCNPRIHISVSAFYVWVFLGKNRKLYVIIYVFAVNSPTKSQH